MRSWPLALACATLLLCLGGVAHGEEGPPPAEPPPEDVDDTIEALPPVVVTAPPTEAPSPSPTIRPETHKVKRGETLTSIARRYGVKPAHIVCLNDMRNRDIVMLGVIYQIPPEGFKCPPNWRKQN